MLLYPLVSSCASTRHLFQFSTFHLGTDRLVMKYSSCPWFQCPRLTWPIYVLIRNSHSALCRCLDHNKKRICVLITDNDFPSFEHNTLSHYLHHRCLDFVILTVLSCRRNEATSVLPISDILRVHIQKLWVSPPQHITTSTSLLVMLTLHGPPWDTTFHILPRASPLIKNVRQFQISSAQFYLPCLPFWTVSQNWTL